MNLKIGSKVHHWTIIGEYKESISLERSGRKRTRFMYPCRCICGLEKLIDYRSLAANTTKSCRKCTFKLNPRFKVNVGDKYFDLTVIKILERNEGETNRYVVCRCICNKEFRVSQSEIKKQKRKRCAQCSGLKKWPLLKFGEEYNENTVIVLKENKNATRYYEVECNNCGNKRTLITNQVKKNGICRPCINKIRRNKTQTDGQSGTPTYVIYCHIRYSCNNPKRKGYVGDKGIKVDERWSTFRAFLNDMGKVPEGHKLIRIDKTKDFGPENCKWTPRKKEK